MLGTVCLGNLDRTILVNVCLRGCIIVFCVSWVVFHFSFYSSPLWLGARWDNLALESTLCIGPYSGHVAMHMLAALRNVDLDPGPKWTPSPSALKRALWSLPHTSRPSSPLLARTRSSSPVLARPRSALIELDRPRPSSRVLVLPCKWAHAQVRCNKNAKNCRADQETL